MRDRTKVSRFGVPLLILAGACVASAAAFSAGFNDVRYTQVAAVGACEDPSCMPGPNECPTQKLGPKYTSACQPPQPGQPTPKTGLIGKSCTEKDGAVGGAIGICLAACKCKGEKTTDGMMPMLPMLPMPPMMMPKMEMPMIPMVPTGTPSDCTQSGSATSLSGSATTSPCPSGNSESTGGTSWLSSFFDTSASNDDSSSGAASNESGSTGASAGTSAWSRLMNSLGISTGGTEDVSLNAGTNGTGGTSGVSGTSGSSGTTGGHGTGGATNQGTGIQESQVVQLTSQNSNGNTNQNQVSVSDDIGARIGQTSTFSYSNQGAAQEAGTVLGNISIALQTLLNIVTSLF